MGDVIVIEFQLLDGQKYIVCTNCGFEIFYKRLSKTKKKICPKCKQIHIIKRVEERKEENHGGRKIQQA